MASSRSPITTHVLNTATGRPAHGVTIQLHVADGARWLHLAEGVTNADGRIGDWLPSTHKLVAGKYKASFMTGAYFAGRGEDTFFPVVEITFTVKPDQVGEHFHIPLLLSPFGYTTYRGS